MERETIDIDEGFGLEYAGKYVFEAISWAKRSRIIQKYTKYHSVTGQVVSSDYVAIQAETVWASLKEQPLHKPITLERLLDEEKGVPIGLGEFFSHVVNKLNNVSLDENRFLSGRSGDEGQTRQSQSSDSAKSLDGLSKNLEGNQQKRSKSSS